MQKLHSLSDFANSLPHQMIIFKAFLRHSDDQKGYIDFVICEEHNTKELYQYTSEGCAYKMMSHRQGENVPMFAKDLQETSHINLVRVEDADIMRFS